MMTDPVDLMDPEYAVPGELERYERQRPLTGPELACIRMDAIEARLRVLETQVSAYGRRLDEFDRALEHLARLLHKHVNRTEGEVLVEP
jgi:hypothetical protein